MATRKRATKPDTDAVTKPDTDAVTKPDTATDVAVVEDVQLYLPVPAVP